MDICCASLYLPTFYRTDAHHSWCLCVGWLEGLLGNYSSGTYMGCLWSNLVQTQHPLLVFCTMGQAPLLPYLVHDMAFVCLQEYF